MQYPANLMYTASHEWVEFTGDSTAKIGLTDYAQDALGDVVFVNLPETGDGLTAGESFGDVESIKAVSDLISPFSGIVSAVNGAPAASPEKINEAPYESWLIEISNISTRVELLDAAGYEKLCADTGA